MEDLSFCDRFVRKCRFPVFAQLPGSQTARTEKIVKSALECPQIVESVILGGWHDQRVVCSRERR